MSHKDKTFKTIKQYGITFFVTRKLSNVLV